MDTVYPILSEDERRSIIDAAKEEILLSIPQIIGNLMANHADMMKANRLFYDKHPEFKGHKDLVASVMEKINGSDPFISREKLEEKAIPEIKKRLDTLGQLDITPPNNKPDLGDL